MSADRLFDSPAPMSGQLGLEHEHAETGEVFAVEHADVCGYCRNGCATICANPEARDERDGLTR